MANRWIKPEAVPIIFATASVATLSGYMLIRNLITNPEVRVSKENRAAGVLDNHEEGKVYSSFFIKNMVKDREPLLFPKFNQYILEKFYPSSK